MKRIDITNKTLKKIKEILKKHNENNENCDVSFIVEDISVIGDLLDFEKEVEKLSIHLKCSEFYSFFDLSSEEDLIEKAKKEIKKIDEINFTIDSKNPMTPYLDINDLIIENSIQYKESLLKSEIPNIFNNDKLRINFERLAEAQRGYPEYEMKNAQKMMGGGIYSNLLEHIGDLTHRMSQKVYISSGDVHYSIDDIYSKLENGMNSLRNGDDFKIEQERNRRSNYEFDKNNKKNFDYKGYDDFNKACDKQSLKYVKEHCKLKIYNEMQYSAKYAAIHLGNGDFKKSYQEIEKLKLAIDEGKYSEKASICMADYEYQTLDLIENKIKSKYKNEISIFNISEKNKVVELKDIVIKKQFRDEGIGTEILEDIVKYARKNKLVVKLEANGKDIEYGTKSKSALVKFYKKIGFNENKGSRKDQDFNSGEMIIDFRSDRKSKLKIK